MEGVVPRTGSNGVVVVVIGVVIVVGKASMVNIEVETRIDSKEEIEVGDSTVEIGVGETEGNGEVAESKAKG